MALGLSHEVKSMKNQLVYKAKCVCGLKKYTWRAIVIDTCNDNNNNNNKPDEFIVTKSFESLCKKYK